ncbi:MAG: hypothetical protein ACKO1H_11415 [Tabrizicola sp.]
MRPAALILAALLSACSPALADPANVAQVGSGAVGAAGRLVLAQQAYLAAMKEGDPVLLLASIRLARSVTVRLPTGWARTTTDEGPADQEMGRSAAPDPASPQVLAIAQALAGEDIALQDIAFDLDAQRPQGRQPTAIRAEAAVAGGQTDSWRIALSGDVSAELGLIGDGDSALGLVVTDDNGSIVCALPPGLTPALCRFTPARNGFFTVEVSNHGALQNSYQLVGS